MSLNSVSSPPTFDAIFNHQQSQPSQLEVVTDEPQSIISRRGSTSSVSSRRRRQGSNQSSTSNHNQNQNQIELAIDPRLSALGGRRSHESLDRQHQHQPQPQPQPQPQHRDSLPFDPESSSTIIATAQQASPNLRLQQQHQQRQELQYMSDPYQYSPQHAVFPDTGNGPRQNYDRQYHHQQQQQQQHWTGQDTMGQYAISPPGQHLQSHQGPYQSSLNNDAPSPLGFPPSTTQSFISESDYQRSSPFTPSPNDYPSTSSSFGAGPSGWGNDFIGQTTGDVVVVGGDFDGSRRGSWITVDDENVQGMDDVLVYDEQEQINELQRIISNPSSHGSRPNIIPASAPAEMYPADHLQQQQTQHPHRQAAASNPSADQFGTHRRNDSLTSQHAHRRTDSVSHSSRSPSPFNNANMAKSSPPVSGSGPFHRASSASLTGSPFMNKPISPPALIIPNNNSPSPQLPPIITAASNSMGSHYHTSQSKTGDGNHIPQLPGTGSSSMNTLFPPANPLLYTGMAGISPIAPNADGPQIFVQPSTPISGLKDGRGVFDAAIRRAGALALARSQSQSQPQTGNQDYQSTAGQQHANHHLSHQNANNFVNFPSSQAPTSADIDQQPNPALVAYLSQWSQLAGGSGFENNVNQIKSEGGGMRPRAKSDSYNGPVMDRATMIQFLMDQYQRGQGQNGDGGGDGIQQGPSQDTNPGVHGSGMFGLDRAENDGDAGQQWQQSVDAWRTALGDGGGGGGGRSAGDNNDNDGRHQAAPNPTLDPRFLPGNSNSPNRNLDTSSGIQQDLAANQSQAILQQVNLVQAQAQAHRARLGSLNTALAHQQQQQQLQLQQQPQNQEGIFKYHPGEFSPTSLSFYASLGVTPGFPGGGTTSAPSFNTSFNLSPDVDGSTTYPQSAGPGYGAFMIPVNPNDMDTGGRNSFINPAAFAGAGLGAGTGLSVPISSGMHARRRSYAGEGQAHSAAGAGTPGYGMMFGVGASGSDQGVFGGGRVRGLSPSRVGGSGGGHRRSVKSEDLGRGGTGWGVGGGGSTADFLQSITNPSDGTLLPPTSRGRASSHSRHSSASSNRSASPALSISSQGSSYSHSHNGGGRMSMTDINVPHLFGGDNSNTGGHQFDHNGQGSSDHGSGSQSRTRSGPNGDGDVKTEIMFDNNELGDGNGPSVPGPGPGAVSVGMGRRSVSGGSSGSMGKIAKQKVTSAATEVASSSRRTNHGIFQCPVPGCNSTFTRHFNLKGHLRSHNDERPYKCLYDGCPKAIVGFARQHDCKRHMLLHGGVRPFECEGCGKKFARLDALTRHHKSEQGQECAISHPLPTNPDGSPMSESQYKQYKGIQAEPESSRRSSGAGSAGGGGGRGGGKGGGRRKSSAAAILTEGGIGEGGPNTVTSLRGSFGGYPQ